MAEPGASRPVVFALMVLTALALVLALILGLSRGADEEEIYASLGPRYEARAWLAENDNPSALASNRFGSTAVGAGFVDTLYEMGADTVFVTNVQEDDAWIADEGGPYADAVLVLLPEDPARRERLFRAHAEESRREGFEPERDRGQRFLYFWWD